MTNKEPYYESCNQCGGDIEITSFFDGGEFQCEECGLTHYWSASGDGEAYLTSGGRTTKDEIGELRARIKELENYEYMYKGLRK